MVSPKISLWEHPKATDRVPFVEYPLSPLLLARVYRTLYGPHAPRRPFFSVLSTHTVEYRVKIHRQGLFTEIGVAKSVENFNSADRHHLFSTAPEKSFYIDHDEICTGATPIIKNTHEFTDGCIVTVKLNCRKWNIRFEVDGKKVGSPVEIPKGTWYPAMNTYCASSGELAEIEVLDY